MQKKHRQNVEQNLDKTKNFTYIESARRNQADKRARDKAENTSAQPEQHKAKEREQSKANKAKRKPEVSGQPTSSSPCTLAMYSNYNSIPVHPNHRKSYSTSRKCIASVTK